MLEDLETTFYTEYVAHCHDCINERRSDELPRTFAKDLKREGWDLIGLSWYCVDCKDIVNRRCRKKN